MPSIRLSGLVSDSIVDGPGLRLTVFTQGCPHHCEGCHNPQTHDFSGGYDATVEEILAKLAEDPLQQGITLSGGEPFCQAPALIPLCRSVRTLSKNIWAYSGYTFEELLSPQAPPQAAELLSLCDVLVDGRFLLEKRNLNLFYRGSENQRVIDVNASLKEQKTVLLPIEGEEAGLLY